MDPKRIEQHIPAGTDSTGYDLVYSYTDIYENEWTDRCRTIMDFIDAMEDWAESDVPDLHDGCVTATFFNNPLNTKEFQDIAELLQHCKEIVR